MTTYKTLFITDRADVHQQRALNAAPPELDMTLLRNPDAETLQSHFDDVVYFISERSGTITDEMIATMPQLKLILRLGSLTHDIDTAAAQQANVIVAYQPVLTVIRVAEHALMQLLTVAKRLHAAEQITHTASDEWGESRRTDENTFSYNWSQRTAIGQLYNRTVGLLGFGEIGVELARRLSMWGCEVLYNKRSRLPEFVEHELNLAYVTKDDLLTQSDYIVNLLPYSPATDLFLNTQSFEKMKAGATLVSVGSGSVIDEAALAEAIRSGKLAGAALDTYEWEPLKPDNPLLTLAKHGENVILTPHIAAGVPAARDAAIANEYANIIRHLRGEPILNRVV